MYIILYFSLSLSYVRMVKEGFRGGFCPPLIKWGASVPQEYDNHPDTLWNLETNGQACRVSGDAYSDTVPTN